MEQEFQRLQELLKKVSDKDGNFIALSPLTVTNLGTVEAIVEEFHDWGISCVLIHDGVELETLNVPYNDMEEYMLFKINEYLSNI